MFEGYTVLLESLQYLPSESDLGIHHIFIDIYGTEAFLTRYPGDDILGFLTGASHDPGTVVFRRIGIADKVNQNELFKIAQLLCMKYEISLNKNPSYLPERRIVQVKVGNTADSESLRQAAEEFLSRTGCLCTFCI